ncbi:hypothetical protein [Caballeronia terrestris]|uniref:hypothetical protein n=1 Tax=Caballeronia terrestris TaxID=1226301 RepID=UPI000B2D6BB4|nr:hypothetical protein [Caballeronia terrestris]
MYQLYLHTLATAITGANQSSAGKHTQDCPGGGSATVTLKDSDNSRSITRGGSAMIEFANCRQFGTLEGQALESINGGMTFAMNKVEGIIGSGGDFAVAADVTASALTFATNTGIGSIDGTMSLTGKHTSNGIESAVAKTSSVTVKRTVNGRTDSITLVDWFERDDYSAQTNTDTVSVDGKLNVTSPDGDASLLVSTPTPVVVTKGNSLDSGNLTIATTVDAVNAAFAGNSNVTLAVDAGKMGTPTAVVPTSIDEMNALLKS